MGIAKRGTRRITVDGVSYRWVARELSPGLRIVVQAADQTGAVLVLRTGKNLAATHVQPSAVAAAIESARAAGWEPQHPGPAFEVTVSLLPGVQRPAEPGAAADGRRLCASVTTAHTGGGRC